MAGALFPAVRAQAAGSVDTTFDPGTGTDQVVRSIASTVNGGSHIVSTSRAPRPTPPGVPASDWESIRAAYEANRHAAFAIEGGHQARNPGQQWRTKFDGCGFTTRPTQGGWEWGLELRAYGFGDQKHIIDGAPEVKAEGQRVTYVWDATVQEWFVNDQRGLEHGFTVTQRPELEESSDAPLVFELVVRGSLKPQVASDGQGVSFTDDQGTTIVTYAGLKVCDAEGKALPARLEIPSDAAGNALRVSVDERNARYPLTIDPLAQQAPLRASNEEEGDQFGQSVAISPDASTIVVGAPAEASSATGVDGNQSDNSAEGAGAAYIFVRDGGGWSQQAYLKASNTGARDRFGSSVSVDAGIVIVGAPGEDSGNGDPRDDSRENAGAVYVFTRQGSAWSHKAYLKASNPGAGGALFGSSVSFSAALHSTVLVGAPGEGSSATGVDGDQTDNSFPNAGAAYVFGLDLNGDWIQQAYLKATNTDEFDRFGCAVSIFGNTAIIGASGEASQATGVNGDQSDNSATSAGAVYVFERTFVSDQATWRQQAYLKASNTDPSDGFGVSVSLSENTALVGANLEASSATGVNGNQGDNNATFAGAAYVFVRDGTTWSQQAYLKASNTDRSDEFGFSVSLSGDRALIGARGEDSNATGVDGEQSDNSAGNSGAAYLFTRSGATWSQQAYLKASNSAAGFGHATGLRGDDMIVGTISDRDTSSDLSAAYIFAPRVGNYSSDPKPSTPFDFGKVPVDTLAILLLSIQNVGDSDLRIDSIALNVNVPGMTMVVTERDGTVVGQFPHIMLPRTDLIVHFKWNPQLLLYLDGYPDPKPELRIVCNDVLNPVVTYPVLGRSVATAENALERGAFDLLFDNLTPESAMKARPALAPDADTETGTFVFNPGATQSLTAGIPSFFGGGSMQLSNFTGNVTLTLLAIPNDPGHKTIRIERGSMTAPSFKVPTGQDTGVNRLTFGPAEASGGTLKLSDGTYTVFASATIVNDLFPEGFLVRGTYSGTYNSQTGTISVQTQSKDFFLPTDRLLNISTRMRVLTGDQVLIGGFIITGTEPKKVIIRGIGPSLGGLAGTLADPTLELRQGNTTLAANDNWKTRPDGSSQQAEVEATLPPTHNLESAIVTTLNPGAYTAILAGKNGASGVGVVEVYDLAQGADSKLANISSRGFVDTGDNIMIGGVIVGAQNAGSGANVMVRAIGPSLSAFGVPGALQDPTLELRNGNGALLVANDNWKLRSDGSSQQAEIEGTTIAPTNDGESAIVQILAPGNYTAIVRGKNDTIGIAMVEAYNLQ